MRLTDLITDADMTAAKDQIESLPTLESKQVDALDYVAWVTGSFPETVVREISYEMSYPNATFSAGFLIALSLVDKAIQLKYPGKHALSENED